MKKIVIVCGDRSADLYSALLCQKLNFLFSNKIEIFSFAGSETQKYSQQILNLVEVSVSGITEVLVNIKKFFKIFNFTLNKIKEINPDLIILMDFPDFNLRIAKALNKKYPILYYISPQIWAWRKDRIKLIKEYINTMVVIFPFEEKIYREENIEVKYFGHPLLEIIPPLDIVCEDIITFMPGSRKNEIKKHLPILLQTKKILEKELPNYQFQIIRPSNIEEEFYTKFTKGSYDTPIILHSYSSIKKSKLVLCASGTVTLELAILNVPFIIFYKLNRLTWYILKKLVKTNYIGMVNILGGEKIIEEFIQEQATPQNIAQKALEIINNPIQLKTIQEKLKNIKKELEPYNATENLAYYIGEKLNL